MSESLPRLEDRLEGGLLGLLIGDALGVPFEFRAAARLPARDAIEFDPPAGFARSHPGVPPGTWSDDGAQALCLLDSLLARTRLDLDDFARRLVAWHDTGYLAVGGIVFDVGLQTAAALRALRRGVAPREAARRDAWGNGNGALMRVLPLALWHRGSDAELVRDARRSSEVTHGHVRSQLCCALYCLWAREILTGAVDLPAAWSRAVDALERACAEDRPAARELSEVILPELEHTATGSGYVVDTLRTARHVLACPEFEGVLKDAVLVGHDTDTTAAVAGGIAGVRDGSRAIPLRWRNGLRGRELVDPLLTRLLEQRARSG